MANKYSKTMSRKTTPQTQPVAGKAMVANNAGGFGFKLDRWKQLDRFLILGAEGGTYYVGEHKLIRDNATNVLDCIKEDGVRAVDVIKSVSLSGRAPKNDPAIFALALACADGDDLTKRAAYAAVAQVCRIGTHLFHFAQAVQDLRGWSRGLRNAVAKFYTERDADQLALQLVKYRQRDGWTHKDVVRLSHPAMKAGVRNDLIRWAVGKADKVGRSPLVKAFLEAQALEPQLGESTPAKDRARAVKDLTGLITDAGLPWEAIPTQALKVPDVWQALLPTVGLTALIRNLGRLASIGLTVSKLDAHTKIVMDRLTDVEALKKQRVHPLFILNALKTYGQGHGDKGNLSWKPVAGVKDALEEAFYLAFDAVQPTGKNWLLGLDVSGSMTGGKPYEAVATMAMVTARVERSTEIYGFTDRFQDLGITAKDTLEAALKKVQHSNFGRTDCSLPMQWALKHKLKVDAFAVYTDNETYAGSEHPFQSLKKYRAAVNPGAKLIFVGMVTNDVSIADPSDAGMMDVVGFDSAAPALMADFVRG
jgi:60 kDa SS-A/Ro ribonucleoprotein